MMVVSMDTKRAAKKAEKLVYLLVPKRAQWKAVLRAVMWVIY